MRQLNKRIQHLDIPERMRRLRVSSEGFPVPWFVPWVKDQPEFRGFDGEKMSIAVRLKRCWLCGEPLGKFMTFVLGPMCAINKNTAEPPCHHSCAEYAAKACPFLSQPRMRRNEKDMPENAGSAGLMIKRNPGVTLLWTTLSYKVVRHGKGILFRIGPPEKIEFYAESRIATRAEILESIETGLPILRGYAAQEGKESMEELEAMIAEGMKLVPSA